MKQNFIFSKLYTLFNCVFLGLFSLILFLVIFFNDNTFFEADVINLVICTVLGTSVIAVIGFVTNFFSNIKLKTEIIILFLLFAVYFIIQLVAGEMLLVKPGQAWDFGVVYSFAEQNVLNGTLPTEYFIHFSNNSALYLVFCTWFSLLHAFGVQDFLLPSLILNIMLIDVAVLLLYLTARRSLGKALAFLALAISFITLPFITYTPIMYSDTMSLPFAIGCVLLWLICKKAYAEEKTSKALILASTIAIVAVLGSLIKPTVLIVLFAIGIDALFTLSKTKGMQKYLLLAVLVVVALIARFGMNWLVVNDNRLPEFDKSQSIPMIHWAMMGLEGKGGYYDPDVQFTLNAGDYDERVQANLDEISRRIGDMGFTGLMEHLAEKLSFTFSDGMYTSSDKLNRSVIEINFLHNYVIYTSPGYSLVSYFTFAIMAGMFLFIVIGCFIAIKSKSNELTFCRVAIFGLTLFLMMFETRSRYLVNFLPLFILIEIEAFAHVKKIFKNLKTTRKQTRY